MTNKIDQTFLKKTYSKTLADIIEEYQELEKVKGLNTPQKAIQAQLLATGESFIFDWATEGINIEIGMDTKLAQQKVRILINMLALIRKFNKSIKGIKND
jgi:hypothetical protein